MEIGSHNQSRCARACIQASSPQRYLSRFATIDADFGGVSLWKAYGSAFCCRYARSRERTLYLYAHPSPAPGRKISQMPASRSRMGWRRVSHWLKSPTSVTVSALGAHTEKRVPRTPSTSVKCAPSMVYV